LEESDVVTLHLPLSDATRGVLDRPALLRMRPDAVLVNTARGGLVDEDALAEVLRAGHLRAVALDVFEHEPYRGPLVGFPKCLLTAHMASSSIDCRGRMELEASEEAIRVLDGRTPLHPVPESEYALQAEGR